MRMDMNSIDQALAEGRSFLSEYESKKFLSRYGIPVTHEVLVSSFDEAKVAAREMGFPVVLKGSSPTLVHKTDLDMVELNIWTNVDLENSYRRIVSNPKAKRDEILVQKMIYGEREFIVGFTRDPQFGPCVMFGVGGVLAEIFRDISFRLPPLNEGDAIEMMDDIKARDLLLGFRGRSPVQKESLSSILIAVGNIGRDYPGIKEIDINPLMVQGDGSLIVVDALIGIRADKMRNLERSP
jgi:acetyl-CoA synthetase (ADP-forming)